ncbi:MAG: hypothetical protein V9G19_04640 [Tetrasphaera sp.]
MPKVRALLVVVGLALSAAACSGGDSTSSSGPQTVTVTESSSPSPSASDSSLTTSTSTLDPTTETTSGPPETDTPGDGSSSPSALDPTEIGSRFLTLADVFSATGEWKDDRFDIATTNQVKGMGVDVVNCGDNGTYTRSLELRLANKFRDLRFKAGQANDSPSSAQTLQVAVIGNNEQLEVQRVQFNETHEFRVDEAYSRWGM